jgi:hypothetical protein
LTALLTACGGEPVTSNDVYDTARELNLAFKSTVAEVQTRISDGAWRIGEYGDVPVECEDGYGFSMSRQVPLDYRIAGDAESAATELGEWLGSEGWVDISRRTYGEGIGNVILEARNPDSRVALLTVDFQKGEAADAASIRADSTCGEGDPNDLMRELYPGFPTDAVETDPLPTEEPPGATPVFGFTEDGAPR